MGIKRHTRRPAGAAAVAALLLLAAAGLPGRSDAFSLTKAVTFSTKGQSMTFDFTGLPVLVGSSATLTVTLFGEYNSSNKYASVTIDGQAQADHTGGASCPTAGMAKTYAVSSSALSDGALNVVVANSANVTTSCATNRVDVTLSYTTIPDLSVVASAAPYSGSTAKAGDSFTVKYTLRCWHEALSTAFDVHFYHCPNPNPYSCVKLGQQSISSSFSSGQQLEFTSGSLTVPASAVAGTSYVRVDADATGLISETVETNNSRYDEITVTALPDLSVSAATVPASGSTAGAGSKLTGSYTVANLSGTSGVSINFSVTYHYCTSKSAASCTQIGNQVIVQNIDSGGSASFSTPVLTLPGSATAGARYIRALVDATQLITELSESNNEHYAAITVGGPAADAGADLFLVDTIPTVDAVWPDAGVLLDTSPALDAAAFDAPASKEQWYWPDTGAPDAPADAAGKPAEPSDDSGCVVGRGGDDGSTPAGLALAGLLLLLLAGRRRADPR